jgi:hypothetical protein
MKRREWEKIAGRAMGLWSRRAKSGYVGLLVVRPWCRCRTTSPRVGDGLTAAQEQP